MQDLLKKFPKFIFAGGTAAIVQFISLIVLVDFNLLNVVPAACVSYLLALIVNYWINSIYTFEQQCSHRLGMIRFSVNALIGFSINAWLMHLMTRYSSWSYVFNQCVVLSFLLVWNFLMNQFWVFRRDPT